MLRRACLLLYFFLLPSSLVGQVPGQLFQDALWGRPEQRQRALAALDKLEANPASLSALEKVLRAGPKRDSFPAGRQTISVKLADGRSLGLLVQRPSSFEAGKQYPVMIAIGGGPPPDEKGARGRGAQMFNIWQKFSDQAGLIVVCVEDIVSVKKPGKELRYHILDAEHMELILSALREKLPIDPGRVYVTGISLGANYAIGYAAARPDRFAGILPVSVEGESREHVLRNLQHVSVFTLEGAKDKNIRSIEGPRKMAEILKNLGYRYRYEEDPDKGHEGFFNRYPEAIKWLLERPRPAFPREVIRCAHQGLMLPARRVYWLEADTRQAFFAARVTGNHIQIDAARARKLTLHLSDRLLKLDEPVRVTVNGKQVFEGKVARSLRQAAEDALAHQDSERVASARLTVDVPDLKAGETWLATLAVKVEPGPLPFWEHFAVTTLKEERKPARMKLTLEEVAERPGLAAAKYLGGDAKELRPDDLILEFNGEPFFLEGDSFPFLQHYWWRMGEKGLKLKVLRQGETKEVTLPLP